MLCCGGLGEGGVRVAKLGSQDITFAAVTTQSSILPVRATNVRWTHGHNLSVLDTCP
jgi:hypothetical protein